MSGVPGRKMQDSHASWDCKAAEMQSLSWYFNRLRRMSAGEVLHRAGRTGRAIVNRVATTSMRIESMIELDRWPMPWIAPPKGLDIDAYRRAGDRILAGRHTIFDLEDVDLGRSPAWNRDVLTGTLAPLCRASAIDYRDENVVGNIKYLWEPNRHLHFVTLAQAYALSKERSFANEVRLQLESWLEQCPYARGPNWSSSLELGIRLINWSLAWQLLGGARSPLFDGDSGRCFRDAWLQSIFQHVSHIAENLSRYSSANNHLIGEAAGVCVAAATWPCWPKVAAWGKRCRSILVEEALKQNAPDGGNREQAISYQQFVLDFLLIAGLAVRANDEDFPSTYWERVEAMIDFVASMMDRKGHVPMFGDADDGYVVRLAADAEACPYRSLVATGAAIFHRRDLAEKAEKLDDKSRWLLMSMDGESRFQDLIDRSSGHYSPRCTFADSGYFILGDGFDTSHEIRLVVDAGPLGYLSLAAHGHADALSIVLSVAGDEILIDPGTFCYHTEPDWRRYFRSTAAHNTVTVDGEDQSVQQGSFMWSNHARIRDAVFEPDATPQRFFASHEGYKRLQDPVVHRREIRYFSEIGQFDIADALTCAGKHDVARYWHFAEHLQPTMTGATIVVRTAAATVLIEPLDVPDSCDVLIASVEPRGGWISRNFGRKVPTHTVRWRNYVAGATVLQTRITCRFH